MQSCQVPSLVRKCLRPLVRWNSKSSGRPLLSFSVPSRLPPSCDLLFWSVSDELSLTEEESLDKFELVVFEGVLDELDSSDESMSAGLAFFRLSCFGAFAPSWLAFPPWPLPFSSFPALVTSCS